MSASVAPLPDNPERCANCGNPVAQRYCGACGQRADPPVHSLGHFIGHAFEDLTHADSRLWRTLSALLFRPGYLTAEFLGGRRARYLPPIRLYLVLSLAFFLWTAATNRGIDVALERPDVAAAQVRGALQGEVPAPPEHHCVQSDYEGPWQAQVQPLLLNICRKAAANPRALGESLLHNLPRAMFLFLPLLAALMMLMYWFPRRYYVEHLLLLVHNHADVFLVLMLSSLGGKLLPHAAGEWLDLAVIVYLTWYLFRSMRVLYGQGRGLTLLKFGVLGFFYLVGGAVVLAITAAYSALSL